MADAPEDRALARKLRNRESAAASRDRARLYTKTLEDQVAALSGQVGELQARVRELEAELAASHSRQRHGQRWHGAPAPTPASDCGGGCASSPDAEADEHGEGESCSEIYRGCWPGVVWGPCAQAGFRRSGEPCFLGEPALEEHTARTARCTRVPSLFSSLLGNLPWPSSVRRTSVLPSSCSPPPCGALSAPHAEFGRCGAPSAPAQDLLPRDRSQHTHTSHVPTDHEYLSLRTALAALRPVAAGPGDRLRRPAPAFAAAADASEVEGAVAGALAAIKCSPHLAGLAAAAAGTPGVDAAAGAATARAAAQRLEGFSLGAPPFTAGSSVPGVGAGKGYSADPSARGRAIAPGFYAAPAALPGSAAASTAAAATGFVPGLSGLRQLQGSSAGVSTASLGSCSTRSLRSDAGSTVHSSGGSSGRNSAAPSPRDDASDADHSAAASPALSGASGFSGASGAAPSSGQGLGASFTGSKRKVSSRQGSVLDLGDAAAALVAPQPQRQQQPSGVGLGALASLSADAVFGSSSHRDAAGRNVRACRRSDADGSEGGMQPACGVAADPSSFASLYLPAPSSSVPPSSCAASNPFTAFATATATPARAGPTPAPDSLACFPAACAMSLARNADHESAALVLAQGFF